MEGDNGGLMLNLVSTNDFAVVSRSSSSKKSYYERKKQKRLQLKERKHKKLESFHGSPHYIAAKPKQFQTTASRAKPTTYTKTEKTREVQDNKNEEATEKIDFAHTKTEKPAKFQVISSLFRHNPEKPELPSIKRKNKKEKGEKLFSGNKFSDLGLSAHMVSNLEHNMKLSVMTSVQKMAFPSIFAGKDVFVKSQTGSGKTLTYAIPLIDSLQKIEPKISRTDGPYGIVLVPTRELALQSFDVLKKLVNPFQWVVPGMVTGGEKRKSEKARLRKGINVLVATPGRLLDHIEKTKCLLLKRLRWLILDEADRLLDMGFEKQISSILTEIKKQVFPGGLMQTVLLSATLTDDVERLAGLSLRKHVVVDATVDKEENGGKEESGQETSQDDVTEENYATPANLKQFFVTVPSKLRLVTLASFLRWKYQNTETGKFIVFLSSRDSVEFHFDLFTAILRTGEGKSMNLFKLHGSMSQTERTDCFKIYCAAKRGILFCTDIASRGLDLPHVNWIVQYNTPGYAADYIHRVGRTARIGLHGQALLFLLPAEVEYLQTLDHHGISLEELSLDAILGSLIDERDFENMKRKKKCDSENSRIQEAATNLQTQFEEHVLSNNDNLKAAKDAYQSFVRGYATYPSSVKHIFQVKSLHLGHVAKSFALRDAPGQMFKDDSNKKKKHKRKLGFRSVELSKRGRAVTEEHSSEIEFSGPVPKKKKKKNVKQRKDNT